MERKEDRLTLREADDEAMKLATLLDDDEPVRFAAPFACAVWRYASIAKR